MQEFFQISALWRMYVYALHGYTIEIMFTALWDLIANGNWKFNGYTSLWIAPIYGLSGLVMERMYFSLAVRKVPFLIRGIAYLLWTYIFEFSTGFILKQFDFCPWDYTAFDGDFMGLITLEYAPLWYIAGLLGEVVVIKTTRQIYWGPTHKDFMPEQHCLGNTLKKHN